MSMLRRRFVHLTLLASIAFGAVATFAQQQPTAVAETKSEPTLQQRLDRLCEQLEKQRVDLHIPGFAIAVVKDDKVILSKGFGVRDVEKQIAVTPQTMFAIGSSSKAFTAALIAMLIDDGKMSWDDPVSKHLPQFKVHDAEANEQMKIRDLLCHRSGLERTDLLWSSGKASREEILAAAGKAEPRSKFREKFHYQNVMYLAAGMAAANAAAGGLNGDWDRLMAERMFTPLGMAHSNTSIDIAARDPNLSLGYHWDEDKNEFKHLPMRKLDTIAPAGAINSNVVDMVQWLRLQLNRGEVDGKRLIEDERFDEMWEQQISLGEGAGMGYGLGWFLRDWQGKKVVEHGGNIDGFGAQVTLVPEAKLGYVLLTNVTATPLQGMSVNLVCDALLGEWKETAELSLDPATVGDYLGKYRFEVLKNDVTVLMKDGKLAVDVPGQMVFTLKQPDESGKWVFDFTDTIAVSFQKDSAGKVISMIFHQSGMDLECIKEGVTLPVEIGLDEAQKYLGKYRDERMKIDATVLHRNGRLAIDVPQQMIYDLRLPNDEGKWIFRATDTIAVRFEQDASGKITGMTHFQGGEEHLLPRLDDAADAADAVPTVEEIAALHRKGVGGDKLAALGALRISGSMNMRHQGIDKIAYTMLAHGPDRFMQNMDMGKFGWVKSGMDGKVAWSDSAFAPGEEKSEKEADAERIQNPIMPLLDFTKVFDSVEIVRLDKVRDRDVVVIELGVGKDVRCTSMIDRENGLPLRYVYNVPIPSVGLNVETTMDLLDWKDIGGVQFPMRWEIESDLYGAIVVEISNVETNVELPADAFKMPKPK